MAGTEFSILAKVKLQADDIQRQLDDLSKNHEVDLHADTKDFELSISVANAVMREFIELADKMVQQVYELDTSLTEFKKVSTLSGEALNSYVEELGSLGKITARTASEMVDAATMFKKSGFSEEDSKTLALVATEYQNVADEALSAGEAANFIISQMKAFNLTAQDSQHIIDAVNEISNNFSVSSADLATNIGKASAALAIGGVEYEQALGMLTAITEIQRSGAKAARGLVTIQSRYNQILDDTASTGQKLIAFYNEHNIQLYDQDEQLRSLWDTLSDVAQIWDTLDENEQKYFLNIQAGANQSVQLGALMKNFQTAIEATNTALSSQGSAIQENSRYMESLNAKSNLLNATFQNLANDVIPKELVANGLNVLNKALELLDTNLGVILTRITLLTGIGWGMSSLLQASKILPIVTSQFKNFIYILKGEAIPSMITFQGIALPVIGVLALLGTTIYEVTKQIKANKSQLDELISSSNDFNTVIKDVNKNAIEEKAKIEATSSATEIYIKRIEELDSKTQLTNAEQIEYHSLLQKIIEIMPSLASSIDLQNNKIIGGTTAIREQIEAWKDLAKQQAYQAQMSELYMAQAQIEYQLAENQIKLQEAQANLEAAKLMPEGKTKSVMGAAYMSERELAIAAATQEVKDLEYAIHILEGQQRKSKRDIRTAEGILSKALDTSSSNNGTKGKFFFSNKYKEFLNNTEENGGGDDSTDGGGTGTTVKELDQIIEEIVFNLQDFISLSKSEIDLLESEYSLMEAQGMSADDLNTKIKEIQNAYHAEAEILRTILSHAEEYNLTQEDINDIQTEINNRSIAWWNWQSKIKQDVEEILYDYQSIADEYQKIIDAHAEELQQQKDALTALQERMSDYYQEQINDIDNQIDALRAANDEIENQISLQEKLDALARAKQSRLLVYSDGGWHYISDADTISVATKDIESFKRTQALEENIAGLEAQKSVLQEVQNSWRNMSQDYDRIQNDWLINQQLGIDTTRDNWQTLVADAQTYATQYLAIMSAISEISGLSISGLAYNPNIDYHALMLSAGSYEEAMKWGAYRDAKIIGEGIVPNKTTQQILNEWTSGKISSLNGSNSNRATSLIQNAHSFATNKDAISLAQKMGLIPTGVKGLPSIPNVGQKVTNMTVQSLNLPNVTNVQQFVDYVKDNMFAKTLQFVH